MPSTAASQPTNGLPEQADGANEARRVDARSHFDLGVSHFDREEWQAALVEFLRSRELYISKGNTKNAAICLRKVGRFDEALAMFEAMVKDFPDLSATDRALAEREIAELQASVGTVDIHDAPLGATVTIDAINRGKVPLAGPIRLSAGSHTVDVTQEGSLPFASRIDLAGKQTVVVHARLAALTLAGRLQVNERDGKVLDVVVDGAVVGTTPWEGAVTPGPHTVLTRGPQTLGSQPVQMMVKVNTVATLEIVATELRSALRVDATPRPSEIALDGTPVSHGSWEGRLHAGAHHIEVSLDGYLPFTRDVILGDDSREVVVADLQLPVASRSHFTLELDGAIPLGVLWGGDLASACSNGCSSSLPAGAFGVIHATYETPSGFGVGIHGGYTFLSESVSERPESLMAVGFAPIQGDAHDTLHLSGLTVGADARYRDGDAWPLTLRLGVGVLVGSLSDARTMTSPGFTGVVVASQSTAANFLYVGPEVRIGRKFGDHLEFNAGLQVLVMTALTTPAWDSQTAYLATLKANGRANDATFRSDSLTGSVVLAATPGVGITYEF